MNKEKAFTRADLRKELIKILPGYRWTVVNPSRFTRAEEINDYMKAIGTVSAGSNRISTVLVERRIIKGAPWYETKYAGFGLRGGWLGEASGKTLAQALRQLQDHYEHLACTYSGAALSLKNGRKEPKP